MHQLQPLLEKLGLHPSEGRVYLEVLQRGEVPASAVARMVGLPRSTVRGALDSMCERGIMAKLYKRTTQYYYCLSPEVLVEMLERRMQDTEQLMTEVQSTLPLFAALHGERSIVPKVQLYEGLTQVVEAFNSTLYEEEVREIAVFTCYEFLRHPELLRNDEEFYIPMRVKKNIPMRTIVGESSVPGKEATEEPEALRARRFLGKEYGFPGTFYIYGHKVLYFSATTQDCMAVIITSPTMAATMGALHRGLWDRL